MAEIVPERAQNSNIRTLLLIGLLVLVALASFGLGRLSALPAQEGTLIIHQPTESGVK